MINKQFDLNSFKAQASKMSDFLNGKGHKIPKSTLYHGLAVMMGDPNWNTLQAKLNPNNIKKESRETKSSYSDLISFAGQFFSKQETFNILNGIFNESYMTGFNRDKAFEQLIANAFQRMMRNRIHINNLTKKDLCDPKILTSCFSLDDDSYFSIITSEKAESILDVIEQHVRGRRLIGNEMILNVRYQFDFTDNIYNNAGKIFYSALLAEVFSDNNELYPSIFVKAPMIRINSRGTRVKVSIFAFSDVEFYNSLGCQHYVRSEGKQPIFKEGRFISSVSTKNHLDDCLGELIIKNINLNDEEKDIRQFFNHF